MTFKVSIYGKYAKLIPCKKCNGSGKAFTGGICKASGCNKGRIHITNSPR